MVKIGLKTHAEVLAKQGDKFFVKSPADNVYATMTIDGTIAYVCLTDESPENAIAANDNRLNNAMSVESFDLV